MKIGFCLFSVALVTCAVAFNLPATPTSFTPSPEVKAVVDGNITFALDLYQNLKDRSGNVFFSPFSISTALAMTSAVSRGETGIGRPRSFSVKIGADDSEPDPVPP